MRTFGAAAVAALLVSSSGCAVFAPQLPDYQSIEYVRDRVDLAEVEAAPMPEHMRFWHSFAWYTPNRLLDVLDVVKVSVGAGPGTALGLYLSDNAELSWKSYRTWRLGMDGRAAGVFEDGEHRYWRLLGRHAQEPRAGLRPIFALPNLRPYEEPPQPGIASVRRVGPNTWDIGVIVHLLLGAEVMVKPFEVADLVFGLWGEDLAEDDNGLRRYPLHEYPVQAATVALFVAALDAFNEEDLRATVSKELHSSMRLIRGRALTNLGTGAQNPGFGRAGATGVEDEIHVGEARFYPERYRSEGSGRLEVSMHCDSVVLRWGVPAEIVYTLSFYNQFLKRDEKFRAVLRHEDGHWVIHEMRGLRFPAG